VIGLSIVNGAPALKNPDPEILRLCDIFCVNEMEVCKRAIGDNENAIFLFFNMCAHCSRAKELVYDVRDTETSLRFFRRKL